MDTESTWRLIHAERARLHATLSTLTDEQWVQPSLCQGWSVLVAGAHVVAGAEQTPGHFLGRLIASGFNFNRMVDADARTIAAQGPQRVLARLGASMNGTNRPPAPVMAMLGEAVIHADDINRPLGITSEASPAALAACLSMFVNAGFPVGSKKNAAGLSFRATDIEWSWGDGPVVTGPAQSMVLAIVGRPAGLRELAGEGLDELRRRIS